MTFIQFETIHFWFGLIKIVLYAKEKAVGFFNIFYLGLTVFSVSDRGLDPISYVSHLPLTTLLNKKNSHDF